MVGAAGQLGRAHRRALVAAVTVGVLAVACTAQGGVEDAGGPQPSVGTVPPSTLPVPDDDRRPLATLDDTMPGDHWHEAFAVSICGEEQAPLTDAGPDVLGIHTHGDGFVHVHPFSRLASGRRARLRRFFDQTGVRVDDRSYRDADGRVYEAGRTECGGVPTELVLAHWDDAAVAEGQPPDQVITHDIDEVRFTGDAEAYTLALVPVGERVDIDAPTSAPEIGELTGGG